MKIIKNSFIYVGSELLNKAIPFLLLPILTKYLTPTEYGIYGIYQVVLSFLLPFISISLDINITRNYFKVSKEKLSNILSSILLILHINLFIAMIFIYVISMFVQNPFGIPNNILFIMPLIIYVQTINGFNLTILRNQEKALKYGVIQISMTLINYGLAMVMLLMYHLGWESLVYSILIAHFLVSIYSIYSLHNDFKLSLNFYSFKEIYSVSLPLIFHLLGGSVIFLSDRLFIQQMKGLEAVGLYSVGSQFGMITMIVLNAIVLAINPFVYKKLANDDQTIVKQIYLFMIGFLVLGFVIYEVSYILFPYIVDSRYLGGSSIIFWVSLTFVVRGFYQLIYTVVVHEGKTRIFMYLTAFSALLNLVLNYYLIELNGMVGAAQATVVAFFVMFIVTLIYINKISNLKWTYNYEKNY